MIEIEMTAGKEQKITVRPETRLQMEEAVTNHVRAKNVTPLDHMRQEDTMRDLLALAATREGLAALMESQS